MAFLFIRVCINVSFLLLYARTWYVMGLFMFEIIPFAKSIVYAHFLSLVTQTCMLIIGVFAAIICITLYIIYTYARAPQQTTCTVTLTSCGTEKTKIIGVICGYCNVDPHTAQCKLEAEPPIVISNHMPITDAQEMQEKLLAYNTRIEIAKSWRSLHSVEYTTVIKC